MVKGTGLSLMLLFQVVTSSLFMIILGTNLRSSANVTWCFGPFCGALIKSTLEIEHLKGKNAVIS